MRYFHILIAIAAALVLNISCSCSRIGDVSVKDFNLVKAVPRTFTIIDCTIDARIVNNGKAIDVEGITGELVRKDVVIGTFEASPFSIKAKCDERVTTDVTFSLSPEVSLRYILAIVREADLSQFTLNYKADVKSGCFRFTKKGHDIPIAQAVKR